METWKRELYSKTICHYGVSKRDGAKFGSGRYPLGSGERPRAERIKRIQKKYDKITTNPLVKDYSKKVKDRADQIKRIQKEHDNLIKNTPFKDYSKKVKDRTEQISKILNDKTDKTLNYIVNKYPKIKDYLREMNGNNFAMPQPSDNITVNKTRILQQAYTLSAALPLSAIGLIALTHGAIGMLPPFLISAGLSAHSISKIVEEFAAKRDKKKVDKEIKENQNIDSKTGLKLKTKEMTEKEDLAKVNPGFKTFSKEAMHNCHSCVVAYDLRRRGYDVTAELYKQGKTTDEILKNYKDAKFKATKDIPGPEMKQGIDMSKKRTKAQIQNMISDGGSGIIFVNWRTGGGHVMNYTIDNGKLVILDAQSNKMYDGKKAENLLLNKTMNTMYNGYARTDNREFNFDNLKNDRSVKYEGKYKR